MHPSLAGGVRTTRQLADAMARRGHEPRIVYLDPASWPPPWRFRRLWRRLRGTWPPQGSPHHLAGAILEVIPVRGMSIRAADVPDADVSIATFWRTMEWMLDWPPSKGLHAYYIQHLETHSGLEERVAATYREPSLKLVVASWLQRAMAEAYGDPDAVLIPNAVDREQFDSQPRGRNRPPVAGIMFSGKHWKGFDVAVEALERVQEEEPELRLVIFGAHPMPRDTARNLRNMAFHLRPSQEELPGLYAQCDVWLLPSRTEGFGLPGLEAAACHCPVVATRSGGPEDFVRDGETGYLVDVEDAAAMSQRLLEVIRMPEEIWRRMSAESYALARTFDWDESAIRLEEALLARVGG
jgi:glycosyltransferase involved in cell wall biosynthesis